MDEIRDYRLFKLILLGDSGVGKSCIQTRFVHGEFEDRFIGIIRIEFKNKTIEVEGKKIKLQIWDDSVPLTRYNTIYPSYFRGARGIIFVYDVTNQSSFDNIKMWLEVVDIFAPQTTRKLLVGNKCDSTENRVVDYATAKEFADSLGIPFLETSAKDGTNVEQAFMTMAAEINKIYVPPTPTPTPTVNAPEQGGVINSIAAYFYDFFGFRNVTSSEKDTDDGATNDGINSDEEKNDKKVILQVSKEKETEISLEDLKQMSDVVLKIAGRKFNIRGKII